LFERSPVGLLRLIDATIPCPGACVISAVESFVAAVFPPFHLCAAVPKLLAHQLLGGKLLEVLIAVILAVRKVTVTRRVADPALTFLRRWRP
jgi:hypothetical protein